MMVDGLDFDNFDVPMSTEWSEEGEAQWIAHCDRTAYRVPLGKD